MGKDVYLEYLKELNLNRRLTITRKSLTYFFLIVFLYFLFSSKYTDSPKIVIINFLAWFTSFSGLISFKYFEIPNCVLEILEVGPSAELLKLASNKRDTIFRNLLLLRGDSVMPDDFSGWGVEDVKKTFHLEERLPWKKIGLWYFVFFLVTMILVCAYLIHIYLETGFRIQ